MKRIFDIILAIVLLSLVFPVLLIIGLFIKFDSKGPIVFKQERVGLNGKPFLLYKFRSMYTDKKGAYYTLKNDPRITKIGRIIRRTSIDELPQLYNVLIGDMSFVGPRPNVFNQRDQYTQEQWNLRNSVLPGITGLSQITYRSLATLEERLNLDLKYVKTQSLFLDLKILFETFLKILSKNGN